MYCTFAACLWQFINGSHVVFNVLQVLAADAAREQGDAVMRDDDKYAVNSTVTHGSACGTTDCLQYSACASCRCCSRPVLQPEARVHISRQYRLHLEQYWQQLQHAKGDSVEREIAVVRDMRAIWHLMEVIFVSTALGDQLSEAFATWVNVCHTGVCGREVRP